VLEAPAGTIDFRGDPMRAAVFFDRRRQTRAIEDFLDSDGSERVSRPLAFLVGGPDKEFHDGLHDHLSKYPLPQRLLGIRKNSQEVRLLVLPDEAPSTSDIKRAFEDSFNMEWRRNGHWLLDRLPPGLTYFSEIVEIRDKLNRAQAGKIESVLNFLNDRSLVPDMPSGKAVCVGISIAWETGGPTERALINRFPAVSYPNVRFQVLPGLSSPCRADSRDWVELVNNLVSGGLPLTAREALMRAGKGLFGASDCMPMSDWFDSFQKLAFRP